MWRVPSVHGVYGLKLPSEDDPISVDLWIDNHELGCHCEICKNSDYRFSRECLNKESDFEFQYKVRKN